MFAEVATGLSSLQTALSLAKTLNAANTQAAINEVKLELQERIFDARAALTAADDRIRELEEQIVQFEDWKTEKQRYRLASIDNSAFVYVHKPGMELGEPPHWLCQTCFENRKKAVLQFEGHSVRPVGRSWQSLWRCGVCKGAISVSSKVTPAKPVLTGNTAVYPT